MKLPRFGRLPRLVSLVRPPSDAPLALRMLAAIGPRAVLALTAAFALLVLVATPADA